MKRRLGNIITVFIYGILAGVLVWIVYRSGIYPSGSDTMCHIYKGDILYKEILKGNFYPLIDPLWYNGVEMMRYWAPLPVYVLALCQALTGGNPFYGYLLFVGLVFFFGAVVWLRIGNRHGRMMLGAFLGVLWFFMPNNLYALFVEGNLPRSLCMIFLPWLLEQICLYLMEKRWQNLLGIMGCFIPITLCHLGYAGMILLAVLLFLIIYIVRFGGARKSVHVLLTMALSILILAVWVVPSLMGGITSTDSSQVMKTFFQDAVVSLNPFYRIKNGVSAAFYFGLAAFLTAIPGMLFGKNKSSAFFCCALITFVCTTTSMYPVISHLPGSQYLWMLRFISIALCMILFGLMLWNTLKKQWLILFCVLLVLDVVPSLSLVYGDASGRTAEERMDETEDDTLIARAKEITTQRLALMDLSTLESTGSFLVSDYGEPLAAAFGAGWQSANTANNIVMLNEAMETGRYYYLFDRCLELGNDSVIIKIDCLNRGGEDLDKVAEAAEAVGYRLAAENDGYLLYHLDTYEQFGTISSYSAIGIGRSALAVTMDYPAMEHGDSDNLNDYSYDELKKYELVFLSGFTYDNKARAETLVTELSEAGVRVVIEADGVPIDEHTGIQSFLDVICQPIVFANGYPLLETIDGTLDCDLFPAGYTNWRAMYLSGLDECWGKIDELGEELMFYGTVKNDNIVMIGLNLSYFYGLTQDEGVGRLLSHAMVFSNRELPDRTIVPLEIEYGKDRIIVRSEYDNVNTGVAYHDIFDETSPISHQNQLTYVNSGETIIMLHYPYLWEGLCICIAALIMTVLFLIGVQKLWKRRYVTKIEITDVVRPVKGKNPEFDVTIPKKVKYTVSEVNWYDEENRKLEKESVFEKEKYRISVILRANDEEHFDRELTSTVNGLRADRTEFLEKDKLILVEMIYQVIEPFRFLQQPECLEGIQGEAVTVKWMISKVAKVGYLQISEGENWIICDTIPNETGRELTADIAYAGEEESRYRFAYIVMNGKLEYSEEFTVRWRKMKIFVTGMNGQLGHDVMNELAKRGMEGIGSDMTPDYGGAKDGSAVCTMPYRQLDITDREAVLTVLREERPDAVIHCAAWTAVDLAEEDEQVEKVRAVNAGGTGYIAEACKELDCRMMYISTDYVFDGQGTEPWDPDCRDYKPLNVYGQTKLEGEMAVSGTLEKYFIVRIAWVFGINGKNFIKTIINVGKNHDCVRVVNDQIGTPTYTYDLARLLVDMIQTTKYGYYHATNEGGYISWYDFTCAIYREVGLDTQIIPVTTEEYGLSKAARPFNSRLEKRKLVEAGFEPLPTWQDALKRYVAILKNEK